MRVILGIEKGAHHQLVPVKVIVLVSAAYFRQKLIVKDPHGGYAAHHAALAADYFKGVLIGVIKI